MAGAQQIAETAYRGLYDGCLKTGIFSKRWKTAKLVLIKKPDSEASSYRPLCLLNEQGKVLERVIKGRIEEHMQERGERLSGNQFGFRKGVSTVDAIMKVRRMVEEKLGKGLEVIAMSLNIRNAFNSIEWGEIRRAMERRSFPAYLQRIIGNYLSDRRIIWEGRDGKKYSRKVERGGPRGLWWSPLVEYHLR